LGLPDGCEKGGNPSLTEIFFALFNRPNKKFPFNGLTPNPINGFYFSPVLIWNLLQLKNDSIIEIRKLRLLIAKNLYGC
jgi:hypothetical protein